MEENDEVSSSKLQGMTRSKEEQHRHQKELTKKALSRTQLHLHHGFWANHHANICVLSLCGICGSEREDSLMMLASNQEA